MKNMLQPYSPCIMKSQLIAIVAAVLVVGCGRYGVVCSDQIGCRALAQARHFGGLFF